MQTTDLAPNTLVLIQMDGAYHLASVISIAADTEGDEFADIIEVPTHRVEIRIEATKEIRRVSCMGDTQWRSFERLENEAYL